MSWDQAYLDAVGVPRWVPREIELAGAESEVEAESKADLQISTAEKTAESVINNPPNVKLGVKALVNNPKAKFAILVDSKQPKAELQQSWKQLKFAWKQWHNQEFPASLFQLDTESEFSLTQLEQQNLLLIDTTEQSQQSQKITATPLLQDKKSWWQYLQQAADKSQLF
ncbi:MAG: hypothetical protein HWE16_02905 [Gammaproteobacteria bacterium]|nr:hypothetical protein [Gammaproteobacteria bacterium]